LQAQALHTLENPQIIGPNGKIVVRKHAHAVRLIFLAGLVTFLVVGGYNVIDLEDPFMLYSTIVPVHTLSILIVAWMVYKDPARGPLSDDLVSVVIPIYNQKSMITLVIESIFKSTYRNLEIIAVNDGSKDGTKEVLDQLARQYPSLKVIHKKNGERGRQ